MLKKFQKHNKRKDFNPFSAMMELRDCSMNFDLKDLDKTFQQSRDFRVFNVTYSAKDVTKNFSSELLSKLSELRGNEWYPIVLIIYNSDKSIHKALGLNLLLSKIVQLLQNLQEDLETGLIIVSSITEVLSSEE